MPKGPKEGLTPVEVYRNKNGSGLTANDVATSLKGSDAMLHHDLKSLGLNVALEIVFEVYPCSDEDYYIFKGLIPKDGYEPEDKTEGFYGPPVYYTSNNFSYDDRDLDAEGDGFESYGNFVREVFKARLAGDVMWTKKPIKTFAKLASYLVYANQGSIGHCYAAVTFIVTIPPYGQGIRAS
ncbi:hypothetical protein Clacol_000146 [Clathrus columnatus]|uniref:Uncharacterized protein n=1 Tax=Clathrus columnatus TaxID=1419009 RepID=A0AAV4ZYE5_9AGAM|nr:hypothetical protein Clacol_000146 [Clathrus columnatus]